MTFRIGQGIDVHPFVKGRKLILGGVEVPHTHGLSGHSDADALSHAICDALLGAISAGDIGLHFSDKDPKNKGRNSLDFLTHAAEMVKKAGYSIANVDSTVMTEEPILRPHIESMRTNVSRALGLKMDQISIKATRPEKLGSLGRGEGLTAFAIALIQK